MMKFVGLAAILASGTALGACSDHAGGGGAAAMVGNFSGTWAGTTGGGGTLVATFALEDSEDVMGTVSFSGSPCFDSAALELQVDDGDVSGTATEANASIELDGTLNVGVVSGTFQVESAGLCSGATGSFTMAHE
jgi:hypothetical protein|nr:hypothetical protein [Kofleriaceae bacterium]